MLGCARICAKIISISLTTAGFDGDGYQCGDINECKNGEHDCHPLAQCKNTLGAFECSCKKGTHGDGRYCEEDVISIGRGGLRPPDLGVVCGNADNRAQTRPWVSPTQNCPVPNCEAKIEIINAWESDVARINKRAASLYGEFKHYWGFSAVITIPDEDVYSKDGFSILLRFAE